MKTENLKHGVVALICLAFAFPCKFASAQQPIASRSIIRIFETNGMLANLSGRMTRPSCRGDNCRFVEVEVISDQVLNVWSCIVTGNPGAGEQSFGDRNNSWKLAEVIPSECTPLISNYTMSQKARERIATQIQRRAHNYGQTVWSGTRTAFFGFGALAMGFVTFISAPTPFSIIAAGGTIFGAAFAATSSVDFYRNIRGDASLIESTAETDVLGSAISANLGSSTVAAYSVVTRRAVLNARNGDYIGPEGSKSANLTEEFDRYLSAWTGFADYLKSGNRRYSPPRHPPLR